MKKNFKRALVLLTAVAMLFCLCGCDALDEMREQQAFYDEAGNILWNGTTYRVLPACEYLCPEYDYASQVYPTAPDVPVLLSTTLSQDYLYASTDGSFLISLYTDTYYCREDLYDSVFSRIQEPFTPDLVCYSYDVYNEETGDHDTKYYTLTQEQIEVIELVIETTEPTTMGDGMYLDRDWSVCLEECSEDMIFRRNSVDIAASGTTYYLFLYANEETLVFTVPEGCYATFTDMVSTYLEAYKDLYWDWDDDSSL